MKTPATLKLYFENPAGRVLEHSDGYVIFRYQAGPRKFPELQALLTHTRNLLERHGWYRVLGDQRTMVSFTEEESTWIVSHWLDGARQGPLGLFGAVLLASDEFSRLPTEQATQEATVAALTYRVFADEAQAIEWLTRTVPQRVSGSEE